MDRIAIEDIHNAIIIASKNKEINKNKIAVVSGSRGADLGLLIGSYANQGLKKSIKKKEMSFK